MTTLCFDFGNTRKKCAVFINNEYAEENVMESDSIEVTTSLIDKYHPSKTILSSVTNHNLAIEEVLAAKSSFHKLSIESKLPITSPVGQPHTIGTDRLAMAVAAVRPLVTVGPLPVASASA